MATLMHENGADIRFIQQMLGHEDIKTTQIYTQVAIRTLQQIHAATHPAEAHMEPTAAERTAAEGACWLRWKPRKRTTKRPAAKEKYSTVLYGRRRGRC